ncbi:MAG: virulence RhuM family protein [Patescibacteria group bacterium]
MQKESNNKIIIYEGDGGQPRIEVCIQDETVWLNQDQMAELFDKGRSTVAEHIQNIFKERELDENSVCRESRRTGADGKEYAVKHYNLDVVISVGYRVNSLRGTQFRIWATQRLKEYIVKGFTLDDQRLKNGGGRYFRELLQRIRDIRTSERNLYQQVTDIYATAIDYQPSSQATQQFFATVQNKMHYAAHKHTAAEIIFKRADSKKPMIGMTNFKGKYITGDDVKIAKNYLSEKELTVLNLLVGQYLDYAEMMALEQKSMTSADWIKKFDDFININNRDILLNAGAVSHKQAMIKAEKEFEEYRAREMNQLESDFDKAVKKLTKRAGKSAKKK